MMRRRSFLRASAGGASLASCVGAVAAREQPVDAPPIPIGFLGASYSHGPDKIKLAMNSPDWEFVGAHDPSEAGRRACQELGARLISLDELFQRAKVVAVESDVRDHGRHALLALKAGKHVHIEKPPSTRLDDFRQAVAIASREKLLLQTGFMWRFNPGFQAIFEAVGSGWLGDAFLVRGYISNNLAQGRRPEWAEYPGGSFFELGSHLVDATVRLLGKPSAVTPVLRHHGQFADTLRDNNVAVLEYDRATAVLVNTALQRGTTPPRSFEVQGSNGTATLQPIEPPMLVFDLLQAAGPYERGRQEVALPGYKRYEADFSELAAAVRGERALSVSLDEELAVAEVVLQASGMS